MIVCVTRLTAFTFGRKLDKQEYSQLDFQKQYEEVYAYMDSLLNKRRSQSHQKSRRVGREHSNMSVHKATGQNSRHASNAAVKLTKAYAESQTPSTESHYQHLIRKQ